MSPALSAGMPRSASAVSGYIPELDGLRGIAISLVMLHRFYPREGGTPWFVDAGWVGVDLFFVVSGCLIAGILVDTRRDAHYFRNFYARRVLRIFPLFYLLVGSILIAFGVARGRGFFETSGSPFWYLLQLGNIPEGVLGLDPPYWLAPVWSLAIEEQFYLTFPFLVRAVDRRPLAYALVAMAVIAVAARTATTLAFPDRERIQYQFTLCRLDAIAAGCAIALVVRARWFAAWRHRLHPGLLVMVAAATLVAMVTRLDRTTLFGRTVGYTVVAAGFGALVLLVVIDRDARWTRCLRWQPLRYLGKLCFGLYLLHRPADSIVDWITSAASADVASLLLVPAKAGLAVVLATLSWRIVEQPFLGLKRRFVSRNHPAPMALVQPVVPSTLERDMVGERA